MAGNENSIPRVVCDAGPLIHLHELGCLELLADFPAVMVPETVWREVERHRPDALQSGTVKWERVRPAQGEPPELQALARLLTLHQGERDALRVVHEWKSVVRGLAIYAALSLRSHAATPNSGTPARKREVRSVYRRSSSHRQRAELLAPFCGQPVLIGQRDNPGQLPRKGTKRCRVRAEICVASIDAVGTGPAA